MCCWGRCCGETTCLYKSWELECVPGMDGQQHSGRSLNSEKTSAGGQVARITDDLALKTRRAENRLDSSASIVRLDNGAAAVIWRPPGLSRPGPRLAGRAAMKIFTMEGRASQSCGHSLSSPVLGGRLFGRPTWSGWVGYNGQPVDRRVEGDH